MATDITSALKGLYLGSATSKAGNEYNYMVLKYHNGYEQRIPFVSKEVVFIVERILEDVIKYGKSGDVPVNFN